MCVQSLDLHCWTVASGACTSPRWTIRRSHGPSWRRRGIGRSGRAGRLATRRARTSIERALVLIDRERSRVLSLLFCDSEETLRDVDEAMSRMNPPAGGGTRASVEVYEVAVDERPFRAHQPDS